MKKLTNVAFIDGQNLYLGARQAGWVVDYFKLRIYLREKYKISRALYFFGYFDPALLEVYRKLRRAGFELIFKSHRGQLSQKKGNVDVDIVFTSLVRMIEGSTSERYVFVSGDGDYYKLIEFLIKRGKFEKILLPNKSQASSQYKKLGSEYYDYLVSVKLHLEHRPPRKTSK